MITFTDALSRFVNANPVYRFTNCLEFIVFYWLLAELAFQQLWNLKFSLGENFWGVPAKALKFYQVDFFLFYLLL